MMKKIALFLYTGLIHSPFLHAPARARARSFLHTKATQLLLMTGAPLRMPDRPAVYPRPTEAGISV